MIRYRNGAYEVSVYVGANPVTGRERRVSRSIRMPEAKRTPKAVRDAEATLRLSVARGEHARPDLTVGGLLDAWLAHAAPDLSPTTVHGYQRSIRLYLKPALGDLRLAKLTTSRIDRLYDRLRDEQKAPATIRQAHAILRRACTQGMRWGWLHANPAALADPPSVKHAEPSVPSAKDLDRLTRTANDDLADLIRLARGSGMRRGELCGLRWSDLAGSRAHVARSVIEIGHTLSVKPPKTGKARRVELGPGVLAVLKARKLRMQTRALALGATFPPDGYVLSDGIGTEPLHPNVASDRFRRHARAQKITCRLHDLRHAYAMTALAAGATPAAVAAQLGHASTKMTLDVYDHSTPEGQRAVAKLTDVG